MPGMARVTTTIADGVAEVRLTRADKLNAIDPAMVDGLIDARAAVQAAPGVRCVVLAGEGRGFCAGLDMASMADGAAAFDLATLSHGIANRVQQLAWGWRMLPMPVIAAVHGVVLGGGLQMMGGADIRIAAPDTRFAILEAKWGLVADMAGFALWRGVRDDLLRELAFTAREFDAGEAQAAGFVTRIADDPLAAARELAATIAARSPEAVRAAKRLANLSAECDSTMILAAERAAQQALIGSANQVEAVRAALAGRPPRFTDPVFKAV
jgi:enoyl-CoA hydratase/carnithine racemase